MSEARKQTNGGSSGKGNANTSNANTRTAEQSPQVELEIADNGTQTLIGFSGIGIDGCAIALPDDDVELERAREIAHDVIEAIGGVA